MSENLWSAFKEGSDFSTLFIIRPNPKYVSLQKLLRILPWTFYLSDMTILAINVVKKDGGIVIAAVNSVFFLMTLMIVLMILELYAKKEEINDIIVWLSEPTWKKFDKSLQPNAANRFNYIRIICTRLVLLQSRLYAGICFTGSIGIAAIKQCIPSMRYELPVPVHMPVDDYRNWTTFFIGMIIQVPCFFFMGQVIAFLVGFLFVFFLLVNEYIEIILTGFDELNTKLNNAERKKKLNINQSLQILVEMIVNCISILSKFSRMMTNIVLGFELMSVFAIFTDAFILLIVKQKELYFLALAITILNVIALGVAYVNDKLKEKVAQIPTALYDLPWYEFTPKQRIFIQLSMKCTDVDISLKSANIHEFNLERFGNITKQTWSNTLVLKRIIEKNLS